MPDRPSQRIWTLEPERDPQTGEDLGEASLTAQLSNLLLELAPVVSRIGGVLAVAADRAEIEPDVFRTARIVVKWESFAPARRMKRPAAVPEAEEVPEPEEEPEEEPVAAA